MKGEKDVRRTKGACKDRGGREERTRDEGGKFIHAGSEGERGERGG